MGLSLLGGFTWLAGLVGSLLWPAALAFCFVRWRRPRIVDQRRFLMFGIPMSYAVILGSHLMLGDVVIQGARTARETGVLFEVWWRILFVISIETALAVAVLSLLARRLERPGRMSGL